MNPLYQQLMGGGMQNGFSGIRFQNPMQKMNYILQAMRNPVQFVKKAFPDIPNDIQNDPNRVLEYLKQTRGISDQQVQNVMSQLPKF